jgi:NosR/NirI family nitrous oxide reductase transcriptional regulator
LARLILPCVLLLAICRAGLAVENFPPPEFESGYKIPQTVMQKTPPPRPVAWEWIDVAVLVAAMSIGAFLVLKHRRRRWIFLLMLASLAYLGFYRQGCVCSIGAIQNVALALVDKSYVLPAVVVLFFCLPLIFTLLFGRVFCGAVCPLGAIQDLVVLKPVRVPAWLEHTLRLGAPLYLALAVLLAVTGSEFIICRHDPFVGFFRLAGPAIIISIGLGLLAVGVFVGRPYCRFMCPYAVILRPLSRFALRRATITPDECVHCRLCENSCPFGAISKPSAQEAQPRLAGKKTLVALLLLLPVVMALGGWAVASLNGPLARMNATVRLAEQVSKAQAGGNAIDLAGATNAINRPSSEIIAQASAIRGQFAFAGWIVGAFAGLAVVGKLILLTVRRRRVDYQAHHEDCLACGRCFEFCPREHQRRKLGKACRHA